MADTNQSPVPAWEVFKAQFAPYFTNIEMESTWLRSLYDSSQKWYNMGMNEAMIPDVLLTDSEAPQAYKDRFQGIFKLKDLKARNPSAVKHIPSVSEYANMTDAMSRELQSRGLNSLATDENLANIIGNNVDFDQFKERIDNAFNAVDKADKYLKAELQSNFPQLNRSDLALALLGGDQGAKELEKKISVAGMKAAAKEFGMQNITSAEELSNLEAQGLINRQTAKEGYQKSSKEIAGLTEAQKRFGGTANLAAELEQTNVLNKQSEEVNRLRSQARAEFQGQTGATSASLRRKRQV